MHIKIIQNACSKYFQNINIIFLKTITQIFILFILLLPHLNAQDLILQDQTISTTENYSADNSITAGPNFTITSSGDVTLNAPLVILKPHLFVITGGKLQIVSQPNAIKIDNQFLPDEFVVYQNFPNPFNPSTKIKFFLPKSEMVKIEVCNTIGQKTETLLNKPMPAGYHEIEFNGQNLSSGIYHYRIQAGEWQDVKKMILLK